jgi:hypothetical protein
MKMKMTRTRYWTVLLLSTTALLGAPLCGSAKPTHSPAWSDPAKARAEEPGFSVQGEYAATESGKGDFGVQVVALGQGTFDAYVLEGGLPGIGWDKQKKRTRIPGATADGKTSFQGEGYSAVITNGKLALTAGDKALATLSRIERKSPTMGAKPPKGAVVLFDGTHVDSWDKGRLSEDSLLMEGPTSKQKFRDVSLHIEFRLPYQPQERGQRRGNSGIYLQGRYETQMLDSFGLEGMSNEAGGIYKVKAPDVNMCFPPLSWQTYDIEFKAPRFKDGAKTDNAILTVKHNGVLVQDKVECPGATRAAKGGQEAEPGPIFLQNHGNPVRYRNIWVVEKK